MDYDKTSRQSFQNRGSNEQLCQQCSPDKKPDRGTILSNIGGSPTRMLALPSALLHIPGDDHAGPLDNHHCSISIGRNIPFANDIDYIVGSNYELQSFTNRLVQSVVTCAMEVSADKSSLVQ